MEDRSAELEGLERLLDEFFAPTTNNERRREIEMVLSEFSNQKACWKVCVDLLILTKNQYVSMYSLTTLENSIKKDWLSYQWEEKSQLKQALNSFIINQNLNIPRNLKAKAIKLLVDIARYDWPHFYPEFLQNIMHLVKTPHHQELGLLCLLTMSEELLTPREDLSVARKLELKQLLQAQMSQIFCILLEFLSCPDMHRNSQKCSLLLRLLTHLFSWVPASYISSNVISVLFKLSSHTENVDMCVQAVSALNELLYRRWIIPNWEEMLQQSLQLVQGLSSVGLHTLDERYLEKISELASLLLNVQTSNYDEAHNETLERLLMATLTFTLQQPTVEPGFMNCLDIWSKVLENNKYYRYSGAMVSLAQEVLNRIQVRRDPGLLSELDDVVVVQDGETTWQRCVGKCIEVVAKVAETQPQPVLQFVLEEWTKLCNVFGEAAETMSAESQGLQCTLRDLCTYTQTVGRLCPCCCGPGWSEEPYFSIARLSVQHLLTLCDLAAKAHARSVPDSVKLACLTVHAQVLAALKAWCHWVGLLHGDPALRSLVGDIVATTLNSCLPLLTRGTPAVLQHCAVHLFATLTCTVRPKCLWEVDAVNNLFTADLSYLQPEDQYLVQGALVNALVLPWPKVEDQLWEQRAELLGAYMQQLTAPLTSQHLEYSQHAKQPIMSVLQLLGHIIQQYKSEGGKVKKLVCGAIHTAVEHSLALFPVYVKAPEVNLEILRFFLVLLECLQQQVGVTFTQVIVQTFMVAYTREQLQVCLAHESGGGLQQLVEILDLILRTPGLSASKLTPMAVNLCLQLAEPILCERSAPSVREALFQLMYSTLLHKWMYFFKSVAEPEQRKKEFLLIMKAMGQSLFLPDINLFRQTIQNLEGLNTKWKLYSKDIFRHELHSQFLTVLLNTLRNKSHALLNEEITVAIFNLASVEQNEFFHVFLPKYLESVEGLAETHRHLLLVGFPNETDMPSFTQNVQRFITDLIYYQRCSSCIPSTSGPS